MLEKPSVLFTSESVTEGHPDKICDQVSDAVLDACLLDDPYSRVACETATKNGFVILLGEITTSAVVDYEQLVRKVVDDIGYNSDVKGLNSATMGVLLSLSRQSADIAQGVDHSMETRTHKDQGSELDSLGAGDQGMMFGYACNESPALMPLPIYLAHLIARRLSQVRKEGILPWLYPDGKTQVTVEYREGRPARIDTVLVSAQHSADITQEEIRRALITDVINPVLPPQMVDRSLVVHTNPSGRFVIGGPLGDAGLTGRKIIVDTYGGMGRHGGGAFSGKDPTKVDRSAAYAARWAAKNLVGAGLADRCEIQVAYAIGMARPLSVHVNTFETGKLADERMAELVLELFDLRPAAIVQELDLRRPIYRQTAAYGHFGRDDLDLPWERLNKVERIRQASGIVR